MLARLKQHAKVTYKSEKHINTAPITLLKRHLRWIWDKYIKHEEIKYRAAVISYILAVLLAARGSSIWKTKILTKGIKLKDIKVLWFERTEQIAKEVKYGIYPPEHEYMCIKGLQIKLYDIKTSSINEYIVRYVGRSFDPKFEPVIELLKYIKQLKAVYNLPCKPTDYAFRNANNRPITVEFISKWMSEWKYLLPVYEYDRDLCKRVVLHSARKTFCNLLYRAGWDMVRISCYGTWSVPSSLIFYYQYLPTEALRITRLILIKKELTDRKNIICDLDNVSFKR